MKIRVDRTICGGHAVCSFKDPELFTLDDEGFSTADGKIVPPGKEEAAYLGERACPERAIRIEE